MNRPTDPITEEQMLLIALGEADADLASRFEQLARHDGALRDRVDQLRRIDADTRRHVPEPRFSSASTEASIERALKSVRQASHQRALRREAAIPKGPVPRWAWAAGSAVAAMVALMVWVANREPTPLDMPIPQREILADSDPVVDPGAIDAVATDPVASAFALLAVFDEPSSVTDRSWNELESVYALRSEIQQ
jgi:hypothetical protein